jgi:hypothetical protein
MALVQAKSICFEFRPVLAAARGDKKKAARPTLAIVAVDHIDHTFI